MAAANVEKITLMVYQGDDYQSEAVQLAGTVKNGQAIEMMSLDKAINHYQNKSFDLLVVPVGSEDYKASVNNICSQRGVETSETDSGVGTSLATFEIDSEHEDSSDKLQELIKSIMQAGTIIGDQSGAIGNEGIPIIQKAVGDVITVLWDFLKTNPCDYDKKTGVGYFFELIQSAKRIVQNPDRQNLTHVDSFADVEYPDCQYVVEENRRQDSELRQLQPKAEEVSGILGSLGAVAANVSADESSIDEIKDLGQMLSLLIHNLEKMEHT